jgi:hypothetical protein
VTEHFEPKIANGVRQGNCAVMGFRSRLQSLDKTLVVDSLAHERENCRMPSTECIHPRFEVVYHSI